MKSKKNIHGFTTPKAYFDTLADRIWQHNSYELPKDTGMRVPEDYFNELSSQIIEDNIPKLPKKEPRLVQLRTGWLVAAAACSILFVLWITPQPSNITSNVSKEMVEVEISLEHYMDDMLFDLPDSSIYNWIENAEFYPTYQTQINKEEIEEYLLENLDLHTLLSYE